MKIELEIPRKVKVLAVSCAAMLLNDRHPNHIFGTLEVEIDRVQLKLNPRGERNILLAKTAPVPIDEIYQYVAEEMQVADPEDPKLLMAVIHTLYAYAEQVFDLEHVDMEPTQLKTDALTGIGQMDLREIVKPGT